MKFAKKRIMLYFYNFFEGRPRVGRRGRGKLLYRFDRFTTLFYNDPLFRQTLRNIAYLLDNFEATLISVVMKFAKCYI